MSEALDEVLREYIDDGGDKVVYSEAVSDLIGLLNTAKDVSNLRSDFADVSSELTRQENENLRLRNVLSEIRMRLDIASLQEIGAVLTSAGYTLSAERLRYLASTQATWLKEFGG